MADELVEKVRYEADITDITAKLDTLDRKQGDLANGTAGTATSVNGSWSKMGSGVGENAKKIGMATLGIVGGLAIIGPAALEQGAQLDALNKKSATVFEGSLGSVQTWARENAAALGMTTDQLTGVAAGVGDLLKPMGFTAEQAAAMSTDMLNLSGALSAWSGGTRSAAEVSEIMTKAMLGERDGLKELGISISEADVQRRLAENGAEGLTGAALEQAKALATQQLIMEKSTDAQKAWADGSMDSIKQQNASKASLEQLKESLVKGVYPALQALLPVVTRVADWLGKNLPAAIAGARAAWARIQEGFNWLTDHQPVLIGVIAALGVGIAALFASWLAGAIPAAAATVAAFAPFLAVGVAIAAVVAGVIYAYQNFEIFRTVVQAVGSFFTDVLWPALQTVFQWITDTIPPVLMTVVGWFISLWEKTEAVRDIIAGAFKLAVEGAKTYIDLWWTAVSTLVGWLGDAWDSTEGLRSLIAGGFQMAVDGAKAGIDLLWGAVETVVGWIDDAWDSTDKLRSLLSGAFKTALDTAKGGVDVLGESFEALKDLFRGAINFLIDKWNALDFKIDISVPSWVPGVGGKGFKVDDIFPDIPRLHTGGTVPGLFGTEVLTLLQPGETVRTASQETDVQNRLAGNVGGVTVVVQIPPGTVMIDPNGISDAAGYAIERTLYRIGRGRK
jgi:hypothetical protein